MEWGNVLCTELIGIACIHIISAIRNLFATPTIPQNIEPSCYPYPSRPFAVPSQILQGLQKGKQEKAQNGSFFWGGWYAERRKIAQQFPLCGWNVVMRKVNHSNHSWDLVGVYFLYVFYYCPNFRIGYSQRGIVHWGFNSNPSGWWCGPPKRDSFVIWNHHPSLGLSWLSNESTNHILHPTKIRWLCHLQKCA